MFRTTHDDGRQYKAKHHMSDSDGLNACKVTYYFLLSTKRRKELKQKNEQLKISFSESYDDT